MSLSTVMLSSLAALLVSLAQVQGNWNEWWTYDGISGPAYWGLINPAWTMCNKGRAQSPVNIDPGTYEWFYLFLSYTLNF